MKNRLSNLYLVVTFASSAFSQSIILDRQQSTFYVDGSVSGGEGLTSYGFGFGATYQSIFDVEIGITRVTDGLGGAWGLGEAIGYNIYRDQKGAHTIFLSAEQSLVLLEGARAITLGGSFSNQARFNNANTIAFSFGASWFRPLNSDEKSRIVFPLQIVYSEKSDDSRVFLAPAVTFSSDNSVFYGLTIGFSFSQVTRSKKDFSRE